MEQILKELQAMMPTSHEVAVRNSKVLAQEVVGTINIPYPFYVKKAKGSRVTDVDGNDFIDLTMGFGPILLGHNPDVVVNAIKETADLGSHFGLTNPFQGELAELVVEAAPCGQKVVFCNSGTEATMYAIRAARALTGKNKIGVFVGSYHGAHDYVTVTADKKSDPNRPELKSMGRGVPKETTDQVFMLPYRHETAFDLIREHKDELALVMIEPVQSSNPRLDQGPFLQKLSAVCKENDVLFMMDEIITGVRLGGFHGAQEFFDVPCDMATYGKAIGGGMPIGAITASANIMEVFNFHGEGTTIFSGGTFNGNPMTSRVGTAVMKYIKAHPEIYPYLTEQSERLASQVNTFLKEEDYPANLMNAQSMFHLIFTKEPIESAWQVSRKTWQTEVLFYNHLHKNGVIVPGIHLFFVSAAHTPDDIDQVIEAFKKSFGEVRAKGAI
ncbi:MAG: aminotransferase class III-fold pyridoxal phosphate-dependent enzyme [Deltaproteobacteria bacterium]|nr:aminotransferase class III-fold pyridoxal phosphate-dependent enzyme [Deltaproteobacteria bacterium]MBW2086445.1 aminotransferase class III-fold pyridoxal phosphate-dependent enzyme [Deltaproteobacteria bacterium]